MHTLVAAALWAGQLVPVASTLGPMPGEERFKNVMDDSGATGNGTAGLGFGKIDDDYFLQFQLRTDLNLGPVGLGLGIPLNLRIVDNDPQNTGDHYDIIRKEDYDEFVDYLRVIRYVRYGRKGDFIYARVGELAAQIGHGTILSRYINNLDINTYRLGAEFAMDTNYGGFETLVSDFGSVFSDSNGSRLVGFRGYVKPVGFSNPESPLNIFALGASVVSDLNAPRLIAMELGDDGQYRAVAEDGALVAAEEDSQTVYGIDAEAKVVDTEVIAVTPYTDLNFIDGGGWGWHLGTLFNFRVPFIIELNLPVRVEYRRFKNNYRPIYFSSFYEIERFDYSAEDTSGARNQSNTEDAARPTPKAEYIRSLSGDDGINGYYADAAFDFVGIFQLGAIYEDYSNGDPNVAVFMNVPALQIIQFKAFYTKTGIADVDDMFTFDDRSYAVAEGRYNVGGPLYLVGRFTRRWQLNEDQGRYESIDSWNAGLEVGFTF